MQPLERFLFACRRLSVDRPPVWLMRQAGRYLPEYQELRKKYDFLKICRTPELIVEASLQPWQRFQMDAVIVFSDILLPLSGMGPKLKFEEGNGPTFDRPIRAKKDLEQLSIPKPRLSFPYLFDAIENLSHKLEHNAALIGFIGSPWTLACYLMQGGSGDFQIAKQLLKENPQFVVDLMDKITSTITPFVSEQVRVGANVIQIFDTWGGLLTAEEYDRYQLPFLETLISELSRFDIPVILYIRKCLALIEEMLKTQADVISVGSDISLIEAIKRVDQKAAIQGNLDPEILLNPPGIVVKETQKLLSIINDDPGFIINLGHGVLPQTPLINVETFVKTVKNYVQS